MKKIWRRLLVLCGIFVLAASAFALYIHFSTREPEPTLSYEVWESASLPVISTEIQGQRVNVLHGYTGEVDVTAMEDTLMPVGEDGRLALSVNCYDNTVERIDWKLRTRAGSRTVAEKQVEEFAQDHEVADFVLELSQYLTVGQDYRLEIILTLSGGSEIAYHTRVRMGENLHQEEMVDFVMDFHEATFDKKAAESYAMTLESDGTADDGTLADVTIHSSFDNLTWGSLAPAPVGEVSCSILEMDGSFGSFLLEYEVEAEGDDGSKETYLVTEAFSIQWSTARFYLMNYHRTMTELFSPDDSRFQEGRIDFGIVNASDVQTALSQDGKKLAFSVAGELWGYGKDSHELVQVFTFRDSDDGIRSGYRRNGIKILRAEDNGDVSFLVYGYMNRGRHEGQVGVSYLKYQAESNNLHEIFFLPYSGTYETLAAGIETLACMGGTSQVYLMAGDTVYSIDWEGSEVVVLADRASERNLVVNDSQTAIAWELGNEAGQANSVQILYLDNGDSQLMDAGEGDRISPQGFIEEDCILGLGHDGDEAVAGAVRVNPYYAVVIKDRSGAEVARYEYDDIYISSVTVAGGQVALERLKKESDGSFSSMESDTLIQSTPETNRNQTVLDNRTQERKARTWYLAVDSDTKKRFEIAYDSPDMVSYATGDSLRLPAVSDEEAPLTYYAFGEGKLMAVASEAGQAIQAVYDVMGTVTDSEGRLVWYRTGRQQSVRLAVSEKEGVAASESLRDCLKQILGINSMDVSSLENMEEDISAMDAMENLFPGRAVNLSGCHPRALLYYLDQGCPVLIQDKNQKSLLLIGYDQYNVEYYDPVRGYTYKQGLQDAASYLGNGEFSFISYLPER